MKYFLSFSYDGSKFNGLQKLKNEKTVQGEIENVLTRLDNCPVSIKCAGRTDKGVHAYDQKCHFTLKRNLSCYRLGYYINRMTSKYIYVHDCKIINDDAFHARFSVKEKEYIYKINTGPYNPILADYSYNYNKDLNLKKLNEAARLFIGIHNYKGFTTGVHKNYFCKINNIDIEKSVNLVIIKIRGKNFLTHMVRNMISIILLYENNKISLEEIKNMLLSGNKALDYAPAPACGLYLNKVLY